jgi:hypothetical protein
MASNWILALFLIFFYFIAGATVTFFSKKKDIKEILSNAFWGLGIHILAVLTFVVSITLAFFVALFVLMFLFFRDCGGFGCVGVGLLIIPIAFLVAAFVTFRFYRFISDFFIEEGSEKSYFSLPLIYSYSFIPAPIIVTIIGSSF